MTGATREWRPTAEWEVLALRADLLARARAWFARHGITEVETPALGERGVTDVHIESVRVRLQAAPQRDWYLHTSPEYPMKRLLAAGAPEIYQICRVFRDGEHGRQHQPEFTLIEWYRHGFDLDAITDDTLDLLATLLEPHRPGIATEVRDYRDVFVDAVGLDPLVADDATLVRTTLAAGGEAAATDRDTCLDFLMGTQVAPGFGTDRLTAVARYPASQAALARLDPDDSACALRFEVFLGDRELANGFVELRDADEQRARFEADRRKRRDQAAPDMRPDETLLAALEHGLPDIAGVAVGFDRVVMAATGIDDIRRVQSFPVLYD